MLSKYLKLLIIVLSISCIFVGCKSPMDRRTDAILETLVSKEDLEDIKLEKIYENDSIFPCAKDTAILNHIQNLYKSTSDLEIAIKEFKSLLPDSTGRIWMKTMTPAQITSFKNYESAYQDASRARWSFPSEELSSSDQICVIVELKALKGKMTNEYLGVFYFGNQTDASNLTKYYLFPMNEAMELCSFYNQLVHYYELPTLEKEGIDVVPADEDPSKTPQERVEIKRREEYRKIDSEITQGLREFVISMNKGGAIQVDEMTKFVKSSLNGYTISVYYNLLADKSEYSSYQWEAFGSMMEQSLKEDCQNVLQFFVAKGTPKYKVKEAFNRLGVKWIYVYRDYYGRNLFTVKITPDDLN